MKKLLAIVAATAALFTFTPTPAEAGSSYRSKAVGTCQHCRGRIYAYYRPINRSQYGWVTSQHSKCNAAYAQRSYQSRSYSRSYARPSYGYSRSYSRSYVRPGISFSFGSSRGHGNSHCR